ncbi:MAG: hypothetical protein ACOYT8_03795 [Candidatus Dependentiae bacterium]
MKHIFYVLILISSALHSNEKIILNHQEYCSTLKNTLNDFKQLCITNNCLTHDIDKNFAHRALCMGYKLGTKITWKLYHTSCSQTE